MLKLLCNSVCKTKSREGNWIQQLKLCSTVAKEDAVNTTTIMNHFLKKEKKILHIINESNKIQLQQYIPLKHASRLISCRDENGSYESLNDILLKSGITTDILVKLYSSIINHRPTKILKKFVITPDVKTITQLPNVTLGIHIGPSLVSWASVTSNFQVLEWDNIRWCYNETPGTTYEIIKVVGSIVQKLPLCSCYVVEDVILNKNVKYNFIFHQKLLAVAIMSCLQQMEIQKTDSESTLVNNLYVLQNRTTAYFYKLILGSEVISPNYIMKKILNNDTMILANNIKLPNVHIDDILKNKYLTANLYAQEEMCWSLLKAISFMHLIHVYLKSE